MVDKTSLILSELYYLTPPYFFGRAVVVLAPIKRLP